MIPKYQEMSLQNWALKRVDRISEEWDLSGW